MPDNQVKVVITGQNETSPAFRQVEQGLDRLGDVGERVQRALELVGVGEVISRLAELTKGAAEAGDHLADAAESTGLTAAELQGLNYAAQTTGVSVDQLDKGVGRLQRTILMAAQGNKLAQTTLNAFGISARNADGSLTSASDALGKIADRMAQTKDGTEKAALAQLAFGRGGAALIPILNNGSEGLRALSSRGAELGQNLSNLEVNQLQRLKIDLADLNVVSTSLSERFAIGLAPSVEAVVRAFTTGGGLDGRFDAATQAGMNLGHAMDFLATHAAYLGTELGTIWVALTDFTGHAQERADQMEENLHDFLYQLSDGAKAVNAFRANPAIQEAVKGYREQLKSLNEEYKSGKLSAEAYGAATDKASKAYAAAVAAGKKDPFSGSKKTGNFDIPDVSGKVAKAKDNLQTLLNFQVSQIKAGEEANRAAIQAESSALENEYKHNLLTIDEYYARKKQLVADDLQVQMIALENESKLYDEQLGTLIDMNSADGQHLQQMIQQGHLDDAALARMPKVRDNLSQILQLMSKQSQVAIQLDTLQKKLYASQGQTPTGAADPLAKLAESEDIASAKARQMGDSIEQAMEKMRDSVSVVKQRVDDFQEGALQGQRDVNAILSEGSGTLQQMIDDYRKLAEASGDQRLITNGLKFQTQLDQMNDKAHTLAQTLGQEGTRDVNNFLDSLENSGGAASAFANFGKQILGTLASIINQMIATYIIEKLIGIAGGIGGASLGSIGGGTMNLTAPGFGVSATGFQGFAAGGQINAGQVAMIGELGPELWVPNSSGTVIPNSKVGDAIGGGGTHVTQNIDLRGADESVFMRARQYADQLAEKTFVRSMVASREMRLRRA